MNKDIYIFNENELLSINELENKLSSYLLNKSLAGLP